MSALATTPIHDSTPLDRAGQLLAGRIALPVMPDLARQIIESALDDFVHYDALADIAEQDPVLTARLLGVANSAYFASPMQVTSVRGAIGRVGLDLVRGLMVGMVMDNLFDASACPAFNHRRFWSDGLATAYCARKLSESGTHSDKATLIGTAALLQSIGILTAVCVSPHDMNRVLSANTSVSEGVLRSLGCTQAQLRDQLLEQWNLPADLRRLLGDEQTTDVEFIYLRTASALVLDRPLSADDIDALPLPSTVQALLLMLNCCRN
ncbi:MAG: HDOD domain-containing protein [Pseudomonadales bacterium]